MGIGPKQAFDELSSDEVKQARNFTMRLSVIYIGVFLLFAILIGRLAVLQFVQGDALTEEKKRQVNKEIPIAPIRGNIYDVNGYPIAESVATQSLFFRIEQGKKPEEFIALAKRLATIFQKYGDLDDPLRDPEHVLKVMDVGYDLKKNRTSLLNYTFHPRRLTNNLSKTLVAYFSEHRDEFAGVEIVEESLRKYDPRTIAVQLVGYLRNFNIAVNKIERYKSESQSNDPQAPRYQSMEEVGFDGLELVYQTELRGKNGIKSYPVNAAEKIIGPVSITPPVKGKNLFLTIDKDVQLAAEDAVMEHLTYLQDQRRSKNAYAPYARAGYVVAMEVNTGRIVAMASMPDYDPNLWSGSMTQDEYTKVMPYILNGTIRDRSPDFPAKELAKHPRSLVPLGSVIKPLTILVGLKESIIMLNERFLDDGTYEFGRDRASKVSNAGKRAYGMINPASAIQHSSNVYMAMIGNRMYQKEGAEGVKIWDDYMEQFGLGASTQSGLPTEQLGVKEYLSEQKRSSSQSALVFASFGQQGKYTTLQLAQYTAMLANRGKRLKPEFVDRLTTVEGNIVSRTTPQVLNEVKFPDRYWDTVHEGMEMVSRNPGVREAFANITYDFAAKTGTSQQQVAGGMVENAVFIAFAPYEKPKLAIAVVVPEGGYGALGAAPIARKVFDAYDRAVGLANK